MSDEVPNSVGTSPPRLAVPALSCDAHLHVLDRRFSSGQRVTAGATADDYRRLQRRLGTSRAVIVTPRVHGTDNRVTLDAITRLGRDRTRGIAVLHPTVDDATLEALDAGGIRGVRFTLYTPAQAVTGFEMVEPLAHRIQALGWHVQLHWTADQIVEHAALLGRLPCPIVFDHLARLPLPAGASHPAFGIVTALVDAGRAWVKLSGAYLDTAVGAAGGYADLDPVARAYVARAPERLVWGSDWPHMTEADKPDDAALFDLLERWIPDDRVRRRVLVDNPATLYDFQTTIPGDTT